MHVGMVDILILLFVQDVISRPRNVHAKRQGRGE